MKKLSLLKIFFTMGALAFVTKPFCGFAMMAKNRQPVESSILVKVFSKRGPEIQDDPSFGISDSDKKMPHPGFNPFAATDYCDDFTFSYGGRPSHEAVRCHERKRNLSRHAPAWLLNSQLLI